MPLLDLHGFTVDQVADAVDRFLVRQMERGAERVRIMTGKGSGKVQAEVIKYLKQGRYPWQYEKGPNGKPNEGVLVVFLD